jgi:hypothetical protein
VGAIGPNAFPRQANGYGQVSGDQASSRTDPDNTERLTGIYGSVRRSEDGRLKGQPRYAFRTSCSREAPVMAGPGDEIAAGAGGPSRLRASHADREQMINGLKVAFVQGRLGKDEFDVRVGRVLASRTYADLAALTADIPGGPTGAQPLEAARESDSVPAPKTIARVTAVGAGASMVFIGAELIADGGNPVAGLVVVGLTGFLVAVLIAGLLTFLSRVFEKSSGRRPCQRTPPSASSKTA